MRLASLVLFPVVMMGFGTLTFGCSYTRFAAPHLPHTPLFDHEGQFDVAASGGYMSEMGSALSGRVAYSPVRHLTLVGGYDGDFTRDASNRTAHHAGSLGVGTYVRHRTLRLEALAIAGVGYGWGDASVSELTAPTEAYALEGVYVQAGGQFAIGFEIPYFEFAGGIRVMGQDGDLTVSSLSPTAPGAGRLDHTAFLFDHFVTVRIPIEAIRFEVTLGQAVVVGDPGRFDAEVPSRFHVTGGIAFQFDTVPVELDDELDDLEVEPPPVLPAPVVVEPAPALPPSYVAPS
jgi:hypothetical protein